MNRIKISILSVLLGFSAKAGLNLFEEDKRALNVAAFACDSVSLPGEMGKDDSRNTTLYKEGTNGSWKIAIYPLSHPAKDERVFAHLTANLDGQNYNLIVMPDWFGPDEIVKNLSDPARFKHSTQALLAVKTSTLPHAPGMNHCGHVMQGVFEDVSENLRVGQFGSLLHSISQTEAPNTHVIFTGAGYGGALAQYVALQYGAIRYAHYRQTESSRPRDERYRLAGQRMGILTFGGMMGLDLTAASYFKELFAGHVEKSIVNIAVEGDPKVLLLSASFLASSGNPDAEKGFCGFGTFLKWKLPASEKPNIELLRAHMTTVNTALLRGQRLDIRTIDQIKSYIFDYSSRIDYAFRFFDLPTLADFRPSLGTQSWSDKALRKRIWLEKISAEKPVAAAGSAHREQAPVPPRQEQPNLPPPLPPRGRLHTLERQRIDAQAQQAEAEQRKEREERARQKAQEKQQRKEEAERNRQEKIALKEKQRQVNQSRHTPAASTPAVPEPVSSAASVRSDRAESRRSTTTSAASGAAASASAASASASASAASAASASASAASASASASAASASAASAPAASGVSRSASARGAAAAHQSHPRPEEAKKKGGGFLSHLASGASAVGSATGNALLTIGKGLYEFEKAKVRRDQPEQERYDQRRRVVDQRHHEESEAAASPRRSSSATAAATKPKKKVEHHTEKERPAPRPAQKNSFEIEREKQRHTRDSLREKIKDLALQVSDEKKIELEERYYKDFEFYNLADLYRARDLSQKVQRARNASKKVTLNEVEKYDLQNYDNLLKHIHRQLHKKEQELERLRGQLTETKARITELDTIVAYIKQRKEIERRAQAEGRFAMIIGGTFPDHKYYKQCNG